MSLILEALKKSEDKRRLGAAPDLATPFSAPRRRKWVWPVAAVLVAAGLIAWALRPSTPPQSPAAPAAPPKANVAAVQVTPMAGQKTGAPLHSVPANNEFAQSSPPDNFPKPAPSSAGGALVFGQPGSNGPATADLENRRARLDAARERRRGQLGHGRPISAMPPPAVAKTPPSLAAKSNVTATKPAPTAGSAPKATAAAPSAPVAAAPPPRMDGAEAGRAPKSPSTVGLTPTPSAPPAQPAKAAPVSSSSAQPYAELPFGVRKSMPELRLSMHVYAADPSHRFVMLNDSRLTEGEKTSDEIFVREIRPDGVVLEFQNQRFFYPRDGL